MTEDKIKEMVLKGKTEKQWLDETIAQYMNRGMSYGEASFTASVDLDTIVICLMCTKGSIDSF